MCLPCCQTSFFPTISEQQLFLGASLPFPYTNIFCLNSRWNGTLWVRRALTQLWSLHKWHCFLFRLPTKWRCLVLSLCFVHILLLLSSLGACGRCSVCLFWLFCIISYASRFHSVLLLSIPSPPHTVEHRKRANRYWLQCMEIISWKIRWPCSLNSYPPELSHMKLCIHICVLA